MILENKDSVEKLREIMQYQPNSVNAQMAGNQIAELIAPSGSSIRRVARFQDIELMINYGYPIEPRNEEEAIWIQQKKQEMSQKSMEESPDMVLAKAEQAKAEADMQDAMNQHDANAIKREDNQLDNLNKAKANDIKLQELYLKSLEVPSKIAKNLSQADRAESKGTEYKLDSVEKVEGIMDNYE